MTRRAWLAPAALLILACEAQGPPPYGFAATPVQHFELESDDLTVVDGVQVRVQRYVEFRLAGELREDEAGITVDLFLTRYYESVERPEGTSEVGISEQGVLVRGGEQGDLRLGPDDPTPTAPSVRALLERPLQTVVHAANGEVRGRPWHASDPLLATIAPLEWLLLALPPRAPAGQTVWRGSREVPRIGQYRLGIQLPLAYEIGQREDGAPAIRARGEATRAGLTLAEGLSGDLGLDFSTEVQLGGEMNLAKATSKLAMTFAAVDGSQIRSSHEVRIRCTRCAHGINSTGKEPDQGLE